MTGVQPPLAPIAPPETGLRALLRARIRRADATGTPQLLSIRLLAGAVDPLMAWARWSGEDRFFWQRPLTRHAIAGLGREWTIEVAGGADRFEVAAARARALFETLECVGEEAPSVAGPLLLGGFSFDAAHEAAGEWAGFPAGRLVLPEITLVRRGDDAWCSVSRVVSPGSRVDEEWPQLEQRLERAVSACVAESSEEPAVQSVAPRDITSPFEAGHEYRVRADRPHEVYCGQVAAALEGIARGDVEKVVLARSLEVEHPGRFEVSDFLGRLREIYPSCVTFAVGRGEATWLGASPERLIRLHDSDVRTGALAGSAPRGRTPEQDEQLGEALRSSEKERVEHAAVVQAIRGALGEVCGELDGPETPGLMQIEGIQHLETPLRGQLLPEAEQTTGVLELLARLHPTPAVGGLPRLAALDWIERFEGLVRGWYAGPVGFVDASGGGEFWVSLRSGLIRNPEADAPALAHARLFGGAGIVPGSDPARELAETRLKLRAMLAPLTEI